MAKKKSGSIVSEGPSTPAGSLEEARLAELVAQPTWNARQAQQVLAAQVGSGWTIAQFAKQHALTAERLYNWSRKLGPGPALGRRSTPITFHVSGELRRCLEGFMRLVGSFLIWCIGQNPVLQQRYAALPIRAWRFRGHASSALFALKSTAPGVLVQVKLRAESQLRGRHSASSVSHERLRCWAIGGAQVANAGGLLH